MSSNHCINYKFKKILFAMCSIHIKGTETLKQYRLLLLNFVLIKNRHVSLLIMFKLQTYRNAPKNISSVNMYL